MKLFLLSVLGLVVSCHGRKTDQLLNDEPVKEKAMAPKQDEGGCEGNSCPGVKGQTGEEKPKARSCADHLKNGAHKCGYYKIYDAAGDGFTVYCDMETEPGAAWTLVMSWALEHKDKYEIKSVPLKLNAPVNENSPNWFLYRLTANRMKSIRDMSSHWRATCSFDKYGINHYKDYVRGNFAATDIFNFVGSGQCLKTEFVNIRGITGIHKTAKFWQNVNSYPAHIDSSIKGCQFDASAGAVPSEDNFGYYATINPKFTCTENDKSTTQWWFGGYQ